MKITLTEGFPGAGTLTRALTDGLRQHVSVDVAGLIELEGKYLEHSSRAHPEASTFRGSIGAYHPKELSVAYNGIRFGVFGIPCTGASRAGKSKNGIASAEEHSEVGYLFLPTVHFIRQHRLDVVVFENVPEYRTEVSADAIRSSLIATGFELTEWVLDSHTQFNTATQRKRWAMVASRIGKFEWNFTAKAFTGTIDSLLDAPSELDSLDSATPEQVAADAKYIQRKTSEGCGFRQRILTRESSKVPTIAKSYGKRQPSASFLKTETSYRMWRPSEVRAIHGFPADFALPESRTTAYEILGQGVCYNPFFELGKALGAWIAAKSVCAPVVPMAPAKVTTVAPRAEIGEQFALDFAA